MVCSEHANNHRVVDNDQQYRQDQGPSDDILSFGTEWPIAEEYQNETKVESYLIDDMLLVDETMLPLTLLKDPCKDEQAHDYQEEGREEGPLEKEDNYHGEDDTA